MFPATFTPACQRQLVKSNRWRSLHRSQEAKWGHAWVKNTYLHATCPRCTVTCRVPQEVVGGRQVPSKAFRYGGATRANLHGKRLAAPNKCSHFMFYFRVSACRLILGFFSVNQIFTFQPPLQRLLTNILLIFFTLNRTVLCFKTFTATFQWQTFNCDGNRTWLTVEKRKNRPFPG